MLLRTMTPLASSASRGRAPGHARNAMNPPRLYDFPTSPFCTKVRALLRYKQIEFKTVNALSAKHWWRLQRHGGGKVPALDWDGEFISGSTRIAQLIGQQRPTPVAWPLEPEQRREHDALEHWIDEPFHFLALWCHWQDAEGWAAVRGRFPPGPLGFAVAHAYRLRIRGQLRRQGTGLKTPGQIEAELRAMLDTASRRLGESTWLFGEQPTVCDFAWYGQLLFLRRSPLGGRLLQGWPTLNTYWRNAHAQYGDALAAATWK